MSGNLDLRRRGRVGQRLVVEDGENWYVYVKRWSVSLWIMEAR